MKAKRLHKRIILSKFILDSLLNFLTPKNLLIIYLSQKLDIYIYQYQTLKYKKYKRNINTIKSYRAA